MAEKARSIIFYAKCQPHWKRVVTDTAVGMLRLSPEVVSARWRQHPRVQSLFKEELETLSYYRDWREAFCTTPLLDVKLCNVNNLVEYLACLRRLREYPLIVILHSAAAGDNVKLLRSGTRFFQTRRGRLLVFFCNEFTGLREKISFIKEVEADFVASQLPISTARWLYADCSKSKILPAPAALNDCLYSPKPGPRPIDIGFRGDLYYSWQIGDTERTDMLTRFKQQVAAWDLVGDIEFRRYPRQEWSAFLGSCKAVIGAEAGTSYLERDDRTQRAVKQFMEQHPHTGFAEIYERFFRGYPNPVSGKAISSRHFEPVGTQTCQILLEGDYNGILKADEHYISVKKDFSNLKDVVRRFKDQEYRHAMVERTYEYVMAEHTYQHRVDGLIKMIVGVG